MTQSCPRCGAELAPRQAYCVDCGAETAPANPRARRARVPGGSRVWSLLGLLVLAAVGALVAITVSRGSDSEVLVATRYRVAHGPARTRPVTTTTPVATTTLPDVRPVVPLTRPKANARKRTSKLTTWRAADAYTVVLASLPSVSGRTLAVATAKTALTKGLRTVGILDSKRFSSLHPGYLVVFTGTFESNAAAQRRVAEAKAAGFGSAYARQITR